MSQVSYKKPPIIEAVIAMHFSAPLEMKWIDAFARKCKARFSRSEDMLEMSASFDARTNQTASNMTKKGHKLTSVDNTNVIIIMPTQLLVSHLAPYTSWEMLYDEANKNWKVLSKIAKHKALSHVSTRYINRIDIPVNKNGRVDLHEYFNTGLSLPPYVQEMALQTFHVNCSLLDASEEYKYVLQLASTPSPLINHVSFIIDIDVMTTGSVPVREDKMWNLIGSLRKHKNDLFESCITPETRKLFQ
jgi:uncharacterized protein (TIGR04255 family)